MDSHAQPDGPDSVTRLAILIVSYNTRLLIRRCLQSLAAFPPSCAYEVCVIDNNSRDDSVGMLHKEFPNVKVIANERNLGYAVAVNQGVEATQADYVLVLNPDIVVRSGAVDTLLEFMEAHPDAGLAGAKLLHTDGTLQHSCRSFYTPATLLLRRTLLGRLFPNHPVIRRHLLLDYDHATPRPVDWVIGACMMVRRAAVKAVGGMDERFFLYFEDVDWCFRMSRQGWKVYYVPDAVMVHEHRRASAKPRLSRSFWAHLGSLYRYYEKWNRYAYGLKRHREVLKFLTLVVSDLLAVNLAFLAAYETRSALAGQLPNPLYPLGVYKSFWVFTNMVSFLALLFSGQYRVHRGKPSADELLEVGRAMLVTLVIIMASTYIARERLIARTVVVFFFAFAVWFVWLLRRLIRAVHRKVLEMRLDLRRVAIVGEANEARELRARLLGHPEYGLDVVGYLDAGERTPHALGGRQELLGVVREHRLQEVIVAPSAAHAELIAPMVRALRRVAVDVKVVSGFGDLLSYRARAERLADLPTLRFERDTLYTANAWGKRAADVLMATVMLLLGAPLSVLYSLVAALRNQPLFQREKRLGRDACPFDFPLVNDSLGLPPSDLVNLPAWIAVLRGQLSVVGPYALDAGVASESTGRGQERFEVRPGLTGLWRLAGEAAPDLEALLRLDSHYVQTWSLGLDFRLLLQSCGSMLLGRYTKVRLESPPETGGSV